MLNHRVLLYHSPLQHLMHSTRPRKHVTRGEDVTALALLPGHRRTACPEGVQEAAAELKQSWKPNPPDYVPPTRGARLKDPSLAPHPVYAAQSLFSAYVHSAPEFEGFNESSVFHGRNIVPSIKAERFKHSLGKVTLLLLEAALYDTQVLRLLLPFVGPTIAGGC